MNRTALVLAACSMIGLAPARAEDARDLYARRCASCHGVDGKGQTAMGKRLGTPDLTTIKSSEDAISKVIENGKPPRMFAFRGKLTPEEIRALAAYVRGGLR